MTTVATGSRVAVDARSGGPAQPASRRLDIQGLRAVAVVLVVLDHAGVPFLDGGFVGVDVFFVISGFLITGHLVSEVAATGRIRFAAFYARRARRILPAALVVAVATVVATLALVSPLRWAQIVDDAIASVLYVPNVSFAIQGTDYLAGTAPSPFQHYWSLGVEEQFYLLWPAIIAGVCVVTRRRRARLGVVLGGLAVASFVACLLVVGTSQPVAFFSLPTRGWELAVGGLVAVAATRLDRIPPRIAHLASWGGLVIVIGSALIVPIVATPAVDWPGPATLLPVLGAALVIGAGRGDGLGSDRLLARRPFVAVGGLAYALYLVHWPLLVIAAEHVGLERALPWGSTLALAALSLPLALLVSRFVETGALRGRIADWRPRRTLLASAAATAAVAGFLVAALPVVEHPRLTSDRPAVAVPLGPSPSPQDFVPSNLTPSLQGATGDTGGLDADGCEQSQSRSRVVSCDFGPADATTTVALFGDSHAGRWFPALEQAARLDRFRLVTYVKSGCRSEDLDVNWANSSSATCDSWRGEVVRQLNANPPYVIVLANHLGITRGSDPAELRAAWEGGIHSSLDRLPARSRIVTMAATPDYAADPRSCLARNLDSAAVCAGARADLFDPVVDAAQREVNAAEGQSYLDLTDYFCNASTCPPIIGNTLVYSDEHHLTGTFSRRLGAVVARSLRSLGSVSGGGS